LIAIIVIVIMMKLTAIVGYEIGDRRDTARDRHPTKSKLLLCKLLQRSRTWMRFASTGAESATLRAAAC